jgi:hypothetical protein
MCVTRQHSFEEENSKLNSFLWIAIGGVVPALRVTYHTQALPETTIW